MYLYEIWEERIDTKNESHYKKISTFMNKRAARNAFVEMNAQCEFENPYSIRKVKR